MKKFLALLLALAMIASLAACGSNTDAPATTTAATEAPTTEAPATAPSVPNRAILGSSTELSGDFRWPGFGGSSAGA